MSILVTGCAGFIGYHVCEKLLEMGHEVIGVDNLNDYYEVSLKQARLDNIINKSGFKFYKVDISEFEAFQEVTKQQKFKYIIHLAAQPGVRHSLVDPRIYLKYNMDGHLNILELARFSDTLENLVYASSSSVYGANTKIPFAEADRTDLPVSLYAATKKCDELLSQTYYHLFKFPQVGLRFFTVYGPWGRPDMSPMIFARAISKGEELNVFNYGKSKRDFTYVDDIVDGIIKSTFMKNDSHKVYNLGNNDPVLLMDFINILENKLGKKAIMKLLPMEKGDVEMTFADIALAQKELGYHPKTNIEEGLTKFVSWFKSYS